MRTLKLGRDSKNRLTDYSLACGYIELIEKGSFRITLYKEGGCKVYQVRAFDENKRILWATYDNKDQAYKTYNQVKMLVK